MRGRVWRRSNPALAEETRQALVAELMSARRAVGAALREGDEEGVRQARSRVQAAKVALGERGPVWWSDGAPDQNRRLVVNSTYAEWHAALQNGDQQQA